MDISSLNAFLHATSKPVQSNNQNCFDRLPQAMNQLIVQCLFPARQAGESPTYRFMRAQILESRQASYHGVLQILYQGCPPPADVQADREWKNGIDHACIEIQRAIARRLFSAFWRDPVSFSNDDRRYFFSPSPTFNQLPFITLLQRVLHRVKREFKELSPRDVDFLFFGRGPQAEEISDQEILRSLFEQHLSDCSVLTQHADIRLLLAEPNLHVHMEERISHTAEQPIIPDQRPQNVPMPSRKTRLLAACIVIASVIHSVCKVVYEVVYTACSVVYSFRRILPAIALGAAAVAGCIVLTGAYLYAVTKVFIQIITLARLPMTISNAISITAGVVAIIGVGCKLVDVIQFVRSQPLSHLLLALNIIDVIPGVISMRLRRVRPMLFALIRDRFQLAQWILLRRRTPVPVAQA